MNCRVIYKADGTVAVLHAAQKARTITVTYTKEGLNKYRKEFPWDKTILPKPDVCYKYLDCVKTKIKIPRMKLLGGKIETETDDALLARVYKKATKGTELEGLPCEDIDPKTLPSRKYRDKWRGKKGDGIKVDHSVVTKAEKRQLLEDKLDVELDKPTPDPIKAMKLQRQLQKKDY